MSSETETIPVEVEGLTIVLPPHLTENFEKAQRQIAEFYGMSPSVEALLRLWIACGTSARIRREFERAALDITKRRLNPFEETYLDDDGE